MYPIKINSLLLLTTFIISGCSIPIGGECKYETITSHAIVKEIKEKHIIVDYYTKWLASSNIDYQERLVYNLPPVHVGEILPANLEYITKGSCTPENFYINKPKYFAIKNTIISFSSEGKIEKDAGTKINRVVQNFLALKKEYPYAKLILYARSSIGSDEYRYSTALSWYAKMVKNKLIKRGLDDNFIVMIAYYNDEVTIDLTKPLPKNSVIFNINLGVK